MFKHLKVYRSITPQSGSASYNTPNLHGRLTRVNVKPASGSWHIKITDAIGFAIWESDTTETGEVNDAGIAGFLALVSGILTVAVTNASDVAFLIQLDIEQYQL